MAVVVAAVEVLVKARRVNGKYQIVSTQFVRIQQQQLPI